MIPFKDIFKLWLIGSLSFLLSSCGLGTDIQDLKNEENIGESVIISGTVVSNTTIGNSAGYVIEDRSGRINVLSTDIPMAGSTVTVAGNLSLDPTSGYYIISE